MPSEENGETEDIQPSFDKLVFRRYMIRWIAGDHVSFRQVESPLFRAMMTYCRNDLQQTIPQCGNTIQNWIMEDYRQTQMELRNALHKSYGQIHLSFDAWTSPNSLAMMGVIAYWIDEKEQLRSTLLGLRGLIGEHSGENMALEILGIIKDFEIGSRVGYFMADNVSSNDTCVGELTMHLGNCFNASERRLRCFGHIVNLVVKALLFGKDAEAFERETINAAQIEDDFKQLRAWRKKGPVGKIHNIVTHIRRTPQRIATFRSIQQVPGNMNSLLVVADNSTRWNSVYNMLKMAFKLRTYIEVYVQRQIEADSKSTLADDRLTVDEWIQLEQLMGLLAPFKEFTKALEGDGYDGMNGLMWQVLPVMDTLLQQLEHAKAQYASRTDGGFLKTSINNAWIVMDKYYTLTDKSPAYVIALVMNPRFKWHYIEKKWAEHPEWIAKARSMVDSVWQIYSNDQIRETTPPSPPSNGVTMYGSIKINYNDEIESSTALDEYRDYCQDPRERIENPINWWRGRMSRYPRLSKMAFDYLSIPAMSAAVERTFSSSKLMLPQARNRLSAESIEAAECLRSWMKLGYYSCI